MNVNDILDRVAATSLKTKKESILRENANNALLKRVVFLALDPFTQFFIRKIPDYTPAASLYDETMSLDFALDQLKLLSDRKVTGNAAIEHLTNILSALTPEDALVIERVIRKDLRCGASENTANKIWEGLIHQYPCMLAEPYNEKMIAKFTWPAHVELKLDGMRFNAIVKDGVVEFRSRNGKLIHLRGNLESEFLSLAKQYETTPNIVFDGELLVADKNGNPLPRTTGNGILNKAVKDTITDYEASKVICTIWDYIPVKEFFEEGIFNTPREIRYNCLRGIKLPAKVTVVPVEVVNSLEEAQAAFERLYNDGQEGIILKDLRAPWEDRRSKNQIKFKGEEEADLRIIGWEEGKKGTKNEGKLGGLVCETEDGKVCVTVGSGYSDEERNLITPEYAKKNLFGTIVAVKYNSVIKDKRKDVGSLFLPRKIEFRLDKDKADILQLPKGI